MSNFQTLVLGWQMVQDNYFLPDVPRNLASKRPIIPVMYGNCRDEWSAWDLGFLQDGLTTLSSYSKSFFEFFFETMAPYLASREVDVMEMLENVFRLLGTADDDHLAWLKIQSDVSCTRIQLIKCGNFTGLHIDRLHRIHNPRN